MAKKPTVDVRVTCPTCESELEVKVYKERIGTPEPAEYDITWEVIVTKQGRLFVEPREADVRASIGDGT